MYHNGAREEDKAFGDTRAPTKKAPRNRGAFENAAVWLRLHTLFWSDPIGSGQF
jgi:hypothetical protein